MTRAENRAFMKDFFERYYQKLRNKDIIYVRSIGIPPEMLEDGANPADEWNIWKLFSSTVTDDDITKLEKTYHIQLPECLRAFFSVYHHRFDNCIGRNDIHNPFWTLKLAYTHQLVDNGYLPFSWDSESIFIRCMDLSNMPDEEACPIVEIDHEPFFDLQYDAENEGKLIPYEALKALMRPVAKNFYEYLHLIYDDKMD